jgi:hypothetical protein
MNGFTAATGTRPPSANSRFAFKVTPDLLMIGPGFAVIDGIRGRIAARLPRRAHANYKGAEGSLESLRFAVRFCFCHPE